MCSFKATVKKYIIEQLKTKKKDDSCFQEFMKNNYSSFYTSYKKCPDNYVGNISSKINGLFVLPQKRFVHKSTSSQHFNKKTNNRRIIVLLESPHKSEYSINMIGPALGTTGEKINKYLPYLLLNYKLINDNESEIYIVNMIQYQCSLGFKSTVFRNGIFKLMWTDKAKSNLMRRIKKIKPNVVVVATTSINKRKYKKEVIEMLKKKYEVWVASSHPSVWNKNTYFSKAS